MQRILLSLFLIGCLGIAAADKVDINKADQARLETVKGIGPALAQKILDYRDANGPFASVDDLQNVKGIGPATLENMKPMLTVSTKPSDDRLDINNATAKELAELPGIGEALSKRIVNYRNTYGPFESVDALEKVDGISKSTVNGFASKVTVGASASTTEATSTAGDTANTGRKLNVWRPGM